MTDNIIEGIVKRKISELSNEPNSIIVLKGIPLSYVKDLKDKINLSKAVDDKIGYFMSINTGRNVILYEEFLLIADFVDSQYKTIFVLNNNAYMEQVPIEEYFETSVRNGLIKHFDESQELERDDTYIGDIEEYVSIFAGLKEHNGYLIGAYNHMPVLDSNKIVYKNLFECQVTEETVVDIENEEFIDLVEEADYIDFVKLLFMQPAKIYLRISNYIGDINRLKNHIKLLSFYWMNCSQIFYVSVKTEFKQYQHRNEYNDILKYYWGYSSFRKLPIYDMARLEQGQKEIVQVSQESIIANIVEQVEACDEEKDFRDVFVTAPTGAGKSVMFQVPAIYLAKHYNLLTIVISPLIGLMNDQVKNLELKNYKYAKTINSDISPIVKEDIINKVGEGKYHILYISPETLLSRSDVEQLIGDRTIGMICVDEAHIVTTWGKQFRPDYWYLGDHIRKLRKQQIKNKGRSFVIATFTATAIYHGVEDMYTETINSLHMLNPITYLGYIKRNDISIVISKTKKEKGVRAEYELDKFEQIEMILRRAIITDKKTLVYFPTVALINRCYEYLRNKRMIERVAVYYGTLSKDKKQENYEKFYEKEKLLMLSTKAFGMGIDINDIEIVAHFAPTGNVCDYVQEIGRAARKEGLMGEAIYNYNPKDFKHINRLHGLSAIQPYQLIKVLEKIDELYRQSLRRGNRNDLTKKRNAMLLDAENFSYIFGSPISDEDNNISKVKTALLLIQKDFENKVGFSPIQVRPIPMFSVGFFEIDPNVQVKIAKQYPEAIEEIESVRHICRVLLSVIWNKDYKMLSFPKFKYMLYSRDSKLEMTTKYHMMPALCVNIHFANDFASTYRTTWDVFERFVRKKVQLSEHTAINEIVQALVDGCNVNKYKAQTICEVVLASMDFYRKNFAKGTSPIAQEKTTIEGTTKYQFNVAVNSYFQWVESGFIKIVSETKNDRLYLVNDNGNRTKEYNIILGILEAMGVLTFEIIGGANSQLYIYINQVQAIKNILNAPYSYDNRILDTISERHLISVNMLTYLYEGDFSNEKIWDLIEDYFLGIIPDKVKLDCKKIHPNMIFD